MYFEIISHVTEVTLMRRLIFTEIYKALRQQTVSKHNRIKVVLLYLLSIMNISGVDLESY